MSRFTPDGHGTLRSYADIPLDCLSLTEMRLLRGHARYVLCMPNVKQTDETFRGRLREGHLPKTETSAELANIECVRAGTVTAI
jgi:hypothetical protein